MGQQPVSDSQPSFAGGLNVVSAPEAVRPDQCVQMVNTRLNAFGSAQKRRGSQRISAAQPNSGTGNPISAGIYWGSFGSNAGTLLVCANSALYQGVGGIVAPTWTKQSGSTTVAARAAMTIFVGASSTETCYIADGGTHLKSLDNALNFNGGITATPAVSLLQVYNQRLWGALANGGNSLYYSNLSSANGSIGGDSLGVGASGGGQIVVQTFGQADILSLAVIGSSLVIYHALGISRLTGFGQSDITVLPQALDPNFEICGPWAQCTVHGIGYAVSALGLHIVREGSVTPVTNPENPDPLPQAIAGMSSPSLSYNIQVGYNQATQEVWVLVPYTGLYVYHTVLQAWAGPWTGMYAVNGGFGGGVFVPVAGNPVASPSAVLPQILYGDEFQWLLYTDVANLYVDEAAVNGSGGSGYTQTLQLHRMYGQPVFGQPNPRHFSKSWRWANVLAALTSGATAPTCVQASMLGTPSTTTFSTPITGPSVYYQQGGGEYGPYVDVTIVDTAAAASQYDSVEVQGFLLGQR